MSLKFSSHFGLSPNDVLSTSSKPIDILLGLDATALLLEANLYTHHIDSGNTAVSYAEPPVRENNQVRNCDPTPSDQIFSNYDLMQIVKRAKVMHDNPPPSASIPSFVSLHKVFLVACVLCLFHSEGYCATISSERFLEDGQFSLDDLR